MLDLDSTVTRLGSQCAACKKPFAKDGFIYAVVGNGLLMCDNCWAMCQLADKSGLTTRFVKCNKCNGAGTHHAEGAELQPIVICRQCGGAGSETR